MTSPFRIGEEVGAALADGRPVVALETAIVTAGLPSPANMEAARGMAEAIRREDAVPAFVGVVAGRAAVGLTEDEVAALAASPRVVKVGVRDLPAAAAMGADGGTTVSATLHLAALAGVRVFATGGLGGVHRGARETWDESADLVALTRYPVCTVCSGVKSVLDIPATLERLETLGVPVVGYGTDRFPAFYLRDSGCRVEWRADSPAEVTALLAAAEALGLGNRGVVVANPPPEELDAAAHDAILDSALADARRLGVAGKAVTPFLLERLAGATGGTTVRINVALAVANARLAAAIARTRAARS